MDKSTGSSADARTHIREIVAFYGTAYLLDRDRLMHDLEYDQQFFYGLEDCDFGLRCALSGHQLLLVPTITVHHNQGSSVGLSNIGIGEYPSRRLFYLIRNRWFLLIKTYDSKTLIAILPVSIFFDLALLFFSILRTGDRLLYFRAIASVWRVMPSMLRERRTFGKIRSVGVRSVQMNHRLRFKPNTHGGRQSNYALHLFDQFLRAYGWCILRLPWAPKDTG